MADVPTVRFKGGVNTFGLHPRVRSVIVLTADIIHQTAGKECVVTSLCDGVHASDSFHYLLGAADFRTRHLTEGEQEGITERLSLKLGDQWDVVLESDHLHVEWDSGREQLLERLEERADEVAEELNDQLGGGQ